ncbi:glycosyltransferase [Trichocoleus sp. FACHB-262]|uniref:glycosyltransferase family 39 protein n=1 Tax=Trichocoleus sp. FACHB-262 TaxID=2692869 RepID=UPI0016891A33|nr:glycosyltransferase [Trichocoleus sp. FACHB-262]MBD2120000.1 glycosyltransferase [Trichocoleus sp. FACHB-262]
MKTLLHSRWLHLLLLLFWLVIGLGLRFLCLDLKSVWTDEFATLVFSLGHSFRTIPLNQAIALDTLLQPLQLEPQTGVAAVLEHLMQESTHPPLYFVLAHWWLQWFPSQEGLVSIWAARSLPAILGALSIPAMFGLGWLAFGSRLVGHLAAAAMAVSPYGIYLAQEARHYTLAVLWVIASLSCLVATVRSLRMHKPLPVLIGLGWVAVNALGMATHYFFVLTLLAEALVLLGFWLLTAWAYPFKKHEQTSQWPAFKLWGRIYAVAAGTIAGIVAWLPAWQGVYGNQLTDWIYSGSRAGLGWFDPLLQALVGWITMLVFLPVQAPNPIVVIVSGLGMLLFVVWSVPLICRGLKQQGQQFQSRLALQVLGGFVLSAIALFFAIAYGLGTEINSAFRFNFVYFPAVIALLGESLAAVWSGSVGSQPRPSTARIVGDFWKWWQPSGKMVVLVIWLVGLLSGLTVATGWGYQKTHRPDVVVQHLQQAAQSPGLIAIAHATHGQTGRLMGLAWELKRQQNTGALVNPLFLLAHQDQNPLSSAIALQQTLSQLPRPLDLWLLNFPNPDETPSLASLLAAERCVADPQHKHRTDGYRYRLYRC